jgi:hypothetical protein
MLTFVLFQNFRYIFASEFYICFPSQHIPTGIVFNAATVPTDRCVNIMTNMTNNNYKLKRRMQGAGTGNICSNFSSSRLSFLSFCICSVLNHLFNKGPSIYKVIKVWGSEYDCYIREINFRFR